MSICFVFSLQQVSVSNDCDTLYLARSSIVDKTQKMGGKSKVMFVTRSLLKTIRF